LVRIEVTMFGRLRSGLFRHRSGNSRAKSSLGDAPLSVGKDDAPASPDSDVAAPSLPGVRMNWDKQAELQQRMSDVYAADYRFYIDVVGSCNLTCPSCPVGNMTSELPPKGLMSAAMYNNILSKIGREHPGERIFIDLYNWGESVLHPQLPELIKMTRERGFGIGLSSNFNAVPQMREIVKAHPDYIRISLSGFLNETYAQTHKGGDIFAVKSNMYMLRHTMDRYGCRFPIQVGFHVYRHNAGHDYDKMAGLCDELGFLFLPGLAILQPWEKAIKASVGEIDEGDREIVDLLLVKPREWRELLASERSKYSDCAHRQARTTINFDGRVPLCCFTFAEQQIIADSFLDVPRRELEARKYVNGACAKCHEANVDMMGTGVRSASVDELARERVKAIRSKQGLGMEKVRF
jgi:MoaA/NifB/PqqE/SkfB family radical SAM enzyme